MATSTWRIAGNKLVVMVELDDRRIIVKAAPVVRRFVGRRVERLLNWFQRQGTVDVACLRSGDNLLYEVNDG